jgi:hypothetical protein
LSTPLQNKQPSILFKPLQLLTSGAAGQNDIAKELLAFQATENMNFYGLQREN